MASDDDIKQPVSPPGVGGQALLKRRPSMSIEDFKTYYSQHHARVDIPWCLANRVTRYVQVRLLL